MNLHLDVNLHWDLNLHWEVILILWGCSLRFSNQGQGYIVLNEGNIEMLPVQDQLAAVTRSHGNPHR
ncbi:hypothetical protein UPYG_G00191540 [Umbra pygmaea]|uniref:Uncharacterized protein n=1 Tax=Umbra pygmaea TaxID=75934 RepID=A0ABD0XBH4_UMBPY